MSCCKAKDYKWCKDALVVDYRDDEGKKYCVFHAPQGKKGLTLEEPDGISLEGFNKLVFERIEKAKMEKVLCDLSGTIFEGDISFSQYDESNPFPEVDFSRATFSRESDFTGTKFSGEADFRGATFSGEASFVVVKFSREANFVEAKFSGGAYFSGATFSGESNFTGSKFSGEANFIVTKFTGEADFRGATFSNKASFSWAKFSKKTDFYNVTFLKDAHFPETTFDEEAVFKGLEDNRIFYKGGDLRNLKIKQKVWLEKANLNKVSFIDTDLTMIEFVNCEWPRKFGTNILYDEIRLFDNPWHEYVISEGENKPSKNPLYLFKKWLNLLKKRFEGRFYEILKREWNGFKKDISCNKYGIKKVEILYRRLKQVNIERHAWFAVSNWHYGEKEMYRKQIRWKRRFFPFSISNLYWLSSGYGERPVRAGMALFFLIIVISILMKLLEFTPPPGETVYETAGISGFFAYVLNTLQYVTFQKQPIFQPLPGSLPGEYLKILTRIVIPLQTALFAFALRNRFRR